MMLRRDAFQTRYFSSADEPTPEEEASLANRYLTDVRDALAWVKGALNSVRPSATRDMIVDRIEEVSRSVTAWSANAKALADAGAMTDAASWLRWREGGEELIAEIASIKAEIVGAGGTAGTSMWVVGLAVFAVMGYLWSK